MIPFITGKLLLLLSLPCLYHTTIHAIPTQGASKKPIDNLKRDLQDTQRFGIVSRTVDSGTIFTNAYMGPTGYGGADFGDVHLLLASRIQPLDDDDMDEINQLTCEPSLTEAAATDGSVEEVSKAARERGLQILKPADGGFQLPFEANENQVVVATGIKCIFSSFKY